MGFCFFNNVAVAAREALQHPGEDEDEEGGQRKDKVRRIYKTQVRGVRGRLFFVCVKTATEGTPRSMRHCNTRCGGGAVLKWP